MKSTTQILALSAVALLVSGSALAGGTEVLTRSEAGAQADLMRTYTNPGGPSAGQVGTRSADDCYADLMRDWDGSLTKGHIVGVALSKPILGARGGESAFGRF